MSRLLLVSALALGLATSAYAQSSSLSPAAEQAAIDYLRAQAPAMGLTSGDVSDLAVSAGHRSALSGINYVYVQQQYRGVPVADGIVTVAVDGRGTVVHAAGSLVPMDSPNTSSASALSASAAVSAAAGHVGAAQTPNTPVANAQGMVRFGEVAGFDVTARQVYVTDGRTARLAWEVQVPTPDAKHLWLVRVDASNGAELSRQDLVVHDSWGPNEAPSAAAPASVATMAPLAVPAPNLAAASATPADGSSYDVYPVPYESPIHSPVTPPADGREVVNEPADATASPFGWHDTNGAAGAEFTITRGNNVHAYQDRPNDNTGGPTDSPDCGAGLDCLFPLNLTLDPVNYTAAATANLFYWNNIIHDVKYQYGFDEASGNFQVNNYGNGGLGNDDVRAEAQDGGGTNNANMATPADGSRPRMQMYEWTTATPRLDGDFDAGIVIHEYTHGTSNRLTGGPATASCLNNSEQMGEGWSDYYGLMLTQQVGDTGPMRRGIGTYALNQPTTGVGIRPAPYSTDFAENGFTYGDTPGLAVPHGVGFAWATILWEVTWDLIDTYGYDPDIYNAAGGAGNQIALALVTEGMKLQPCLPGFVDGRDAILAADQALYGGVNGDLLWAAFARRGLGFSADQGSSGTNADNVEAFDTPIVAGSLSISPSSLSFSAPSGGSDSGTVTITNNGAPGDGDGVFDAYIANLQQPDDASFGSGGPDAFGYAWIDSDEPGGPAVDFQDISGTGTAVTWTATGTFPAGDEGYADVALPFSFPYYGGTKTSVRVYSNGFLTFSAHNANTFTNNAVPSTATPNDVIAPFWDDLDASAGGAVYTGTLGDGRFVVQYNAVPRWNTTTTETFQVILSDDGTIEYQYGTMNGTLNSASVGIENSDGTVGLQVAFNSAYVASNKAVLFYSPVVWASVTPTSGTVDEGTSEDLTVTVDATDLPDGTYTADLIIETNDTSLPTTTIPITFEVGGAGPSGVSILIDDPKGFRFLGTPSPGLTVDDLADMNLVRGVPGYYPGANPANLETAYDAATGTWVTSSGTGEVLELGKAFRWRFYDHSNGNPTISQSVPLPMTLTTELPPNTSDVTLELQTGGTRMNYLANPFGTDLDLTGLQTWPGGTNVSPNAPVWVYDPVAKTFVTAPATIPAWMGFRVRAKGPTVGGNPRLLTIPASAALTGDRPVARAAARTAELTPGLTFTLDGIDGDGERRIADRSFAMVFSEDARAAYDADEDVAKFQVPAESYALIGSRAGDAFVGYDVRPFAAGEIPLAIEARGTESRFTLRWDAEALPAGLPVVLVDLVTGREIDVRTASSYAFDVSRTLEAFDEVIPSSDFADGASATDRFVLRIGTPASAEAAVTEVELSSIAPNPSAGSARVSFAIPEAGAVRVSVYDVRGRAVATLVDGPLSAGRHEATLESGSLAAGVYVVRLEAAGAVVTRQAVVVR